MKNHTVFISGVSLLAVLAVAGCANSGPSAGSGSASSETAFARPDPVYPKTYDIQLGSPGFVDVTKTKAAAPTPGVPEAASGGLVNPSATAPGASGAPAASPSKVAFVTQIVDVAPRKKIYYQVVSPVPANVAVYQRSTPQSPRVLINEIQGTNIISWVRSDYVRLEFDFSPVKAGASAPLKFVVSNRDLVRRK